MANEVSIVEYYIAVIPHKAGEAARVLTAFKEAGINLMGFLGHWKTAWNAEIIFILEEKTPGVAAAARKAGVTLGTKHRAFLATGTDCPGVVAELMQKLAAASVNVTSTHAVAAGGGRFGALLGVEPANMRKAAKVLGVG